MKKMEFSKRSFLHRNKYFSVVCDTVSTPIGKKEYTYVAKNSAVVIVPFLDNENVLLLKHYRYLSDGVSYEFPAGGIEDGEKPKDAALRELEEETGYTSSRLYSIGSFYSSRGFSNEIVYVFSAYDLSLKTSKVDEAEEIIELVEMSAKEVHKKAKTFEINGSSSLIAAFAALEPNND